jgi:hypothetical protein
MRDISKGLLALQRILLSRPVIYLGAMIIILGPASYRIYTWKKEVAQEGIQKVAVKEIKKAEKEVFPKEPHPSLADLPDMKPPMAAEEKKQVILTLDWGGDIEEKDLSDIQDKNHQEEEALQKIRRPFSAHTMTEKETRFRELSLKTEPVSNIIIHDTGVVFFWADPKDAGNPQKRGEIMKNLANLYKENCQYEKPVTVVFLISGRPAQSLQFFKE